MRLTLSYITLSNQQSTTEDIWKFEYFNFHGESTIKMPFATITKLVSAKKKKNHQRGVLGL